MKNKKSNIILYILLVLLTILTIYWYYKYVTEVNNLNNTISKLSEENKYYTIKDQDLKECPLCESDASLHKVGEIIYYIKCNKCGLETQGYSTIDDTIKAWNKLEKSLDTP